MSDRNTQNGSGEKILFDPEHGNQIANKISSNLKDEKA